MTNTSNSCEKTEPLIITMEIKGFQGPLKNSRTSKASKMTLLDSRVFKGFKDLGEPCKSSYDVIGESDRNGQSV